MRQSLRIFQIAFTYVGTVVGAGFATGQEILQFFTKYGWIASFTIGVSSLIFLFLGTKLMLIAQQIQARSYEDVNHYLFGSRIGGWVSIFAMIVIVSVNGVMLAGAGSVFVQQLNFHYQTGLLLTIVSAYFIINRGMSAILSLNSLVVPTMLVFTVMIVTQTLHMPNAGRVFTITTDTSWYAAWTAPLLYSAFNLAMAQAVLVPLGASMPNKRIIRIGGAIGGVLIGILLLAGHLALSVHMPGIQQFDIPMGEIAHSLGMTIQLIYVLLIFSEIFTTFIADLYGITLQLHQRTGVPKKLITAVIMMICFTISQFGFRNLISFLYPLFGMFSLIWLYLLLRAAYPPKPWPEPPSAPSPAAGTLKLKPLPRKK
ncbi:MAG: hypothetical protein E6230_14285 [Paenibacillus dendritiformis]|uniref:YkvI family membrane protein n=1 Tax=uncultured Paenibacillus sp. TaxID=227322 RepID=UPI0025CD3CB3|nr:hypothetical protein [uncultured Paenibacillus sp.]MDU5143344.1 hypothetical protein [Paenibacillus dendritiformis]